VSADPETGNALTIAPEASATEGVKIAVPTIDPGCGDDLVGCRVTSRTMKSWPPPSAMPSISCGS
jgi:hypothetical protein